MSDTTIWIGLDLGLRRTRISVVDALGAELLNDECDTKLAPLKKVLAQFPVERIGLIATEAGNDVHIVRKLRENGFRVAIFEARQASKFLAIRRNKTDAGDARGLADLARLGRNSVSQVHLKSPECQQLRGMLVMRRRLVMMRVAGEATLRARLGAHGLVLPAARAPGQLRAHVHDALAQLPPDERRGLKADLRPLVELCESLRAYVKKLDGDLEKIARSDPACRLLMEVPGVGPICAISFYTAIEDPSRFKSPTQVGAYLGLAPRRHQSGATSRTVGITKSGNKLTRTSLVTAATVFGNTAPDCGLKRWYLALRDRAGSGRARVALARKLAIILLSMWKNGSHFELHGTSGRPPRGQAEEGTSADQTKSHAIDDQHHSVTPVLATPHVEPLRDR